jgi:hypothetical protein
MIADLVEHAATAVEPAGVLLRRMGAAREVLARRRRRRHREPGAAFDLRRGKELVALWRLE